MNGTAEQLPLLELTPEEVRAELGQAMICTATDLPLGPDCHKDGGHRPCYGLIGITWDFALGLDPDLSAYRCPAWQFIFFSIEKLPVTGQRRLASGK